HVDLRRDELIGHEHLGRELLEFGDLLGRRVVRGRAPRLLPRLDHLLVHLFADGPWDRLDVELRWRPGREPGFDLLGIPGGVAGAVEGPDRDVVGPDVVWIAIPAALGVCQYD